MLAQSFLALQRGAADAEAHGLPPVGPPLSRPATHRRVLVWLLQDLALWFIASDQIKTFRPRRN